MSRSRRTVVPSPGGAGTTEARGTAAEIPGAAMGRRGAARTCERKKRRPAWLVREERDSPLASFFGGGVEYDVGLDFRRLGAFALDLSIFLERLAVPQVWGRHVELKFRSLGRHRAEGLYYPDRRILVVDLACWRSFAHEFGHLVDYRAGSRLRRGEPRSHDPGFERFRAHLARRMAAVGSRDPRLSSGGGRLSWAYFSTPLECFARAFEQWVAEATEQPSLLVGQPWRYRTDPLFFEEIPPGLEDYFRGILDGGPADGPGAARLLP